MQQHLLKLALFCFLFAQFAVTAHALEHALSHDDVHECELCLRYLSEQDGIDNAINIIQVAEYNTGPVNLPVSRYSSNPTRDLRNKSPPFSLK